MPLVTATTDLLIGQYRASENLKYVINVLIDELRLTAEGAVSELRLQGLIDDAEGVWLDYIAARLGLQRPYTTEGGADPRWGFDSAGEGFDLVPFRGEAFNDALFPLPDVIYRRMLKARTVALRSLGGIDDFRRALAHIDTNAQAVDNFDMSLTITAEENRHWEIQLADRYRALPRPAGVSVTYATP